MAGANLSSGFSSHNPEKESSGDFPMEQLRASLDSRRGRSEAAGDFMRMDSVRAHVEQERPRPTVDIHNLDDHTERLEARRYASVMAEIGRHVGQLRREEIEASTMMWSEDELHPQGGQYESV